MNFNKVTAVSGRDKKALKIASCGVVASVIFHHPWVKYGGILALTKRSK